MTAHWRCVMRCLVSVSTTPLPPSALSSWRSASPTSPVGGLSTCLCPKASCRASRGRRAHTCWPAGPRPPIMVDVAGRAICGEAHRSPPRGVLPTTTALGVLVVGAGRPYAADDVAAACQVSLLGQLPLDPRAVWAEGRERALASGAARCSGRHVESLRVHRTLGQCHDSGSGGPAKCCG
jgi:hypothetical protein